MKNAINQEVKNIEISKIRQFTSLCKNYDNVLMLTLGQPNFNTPLPIKNKAIEGIQNNFTTYTPNNGNSSVVKNISDYASTYFNLDYKPSEIICTVGVTEALSVIFKTILEQGDEVIIPAPYYPGYPPLVTLNGGVIKYVDTRNTGFELTKELLENAITKKTKAIILNYPNNPTSVSLSKKNCEEIAYFLKDKDIFIVLDEVYNRIIFEEYFSISQFPFLREKLIIVNGLSKSHAMTGWRFGFIMANQSIVNELSKVHQYFVTSTSSITQYATLAIKDCDLSYMINTYKENLEYAYTELTQLGFSIVKPKGGFFLFANIKKFGYDADSFAYKLLDQCQVAVIPGSGFGDYNDYIRISCATSKEVLVEAIKRITTFLDKFTKKIQQY